MVANSVRVISVQRRVLGRNNHVKYLKIAGMGLVLVLVSALAGLRVFGFEPSDMRPGLWLTGELVTEPVTDWDFTNQYEEIFVQTNAWYGIPHSVTVYCAQYNGDFYLFSAYYGGGNFPDMRGWNQNVMRDPRVRLKIGNRLFDQTLRYVDDESIRTQVHQAFADKYPEWPSPGQENVHIFLVERG